MKASESWRQFLGWAAIAGLVGVDGLFGIIGKAEAKGTLGWTFSAIMVVISIILAALGITVGLIRFIKWAWRD
jgi:hypothetical protein